MKKNGFSNIRRWLWIYLIFVALASALTFLVVYWEMTATLKSQLTLIAESYPGRGEDLLEANLTALKIRIFFLFTMGLMVICVTGLLWLKVTARRLNHPIHQIRQAVARLAGGHLNETVNIDTPDEFGHIAGGINELAANLQELLLYIWKQTGQCQNALMHIEAVSASPDLSPQDLEHLKLLKDAVQNLRDMAKAYVFYDVRLEGEQALAINEPGQTFSVKEN